MEKYKYKRLSLPSSDPEKISILNQLGEEGWEVVCPLVYSTKQSGTHTEVTVLLLKKKVE